jgi:hypothetical protein
MNPITAEEARSLAEDVVETLDKIYDHIREYAKKHDNTGYFVKCFQAKRIKAELERNGYYVSASEEQTQFDGRMIYLYISWDKET